VTRIVYVFLFVVCRIYFAAFFGEAAFLALGLADGFFVAVFFVPVDFGFLAADDFFGFDAGFVATFFVELAAAVGAAGATAAGAVPVVVAAGVVLFLTAVDFVVAFVFGLTCRGFLVALAPAGFELDRDFVVLLAFAFFGLAAAFPLLAVAVRLADFGPGDFDALRFFAPPVDVDGVVDVLLFLTLVDDFFLIPVDSPFVPSLNEPLAPLPFVCLKCLDLTPFFKATLRC